MSLVDKHSTSDGWRGKIADDFTFDFVEEIALAIGDYILQNGGTSTYIGYDTRFLSCEFARHASKSFRQIGIDTFLSSRPTPTPVVSYHTNQSKMICGINITASHNPYFYNGVKLRMGFGGAPNSETIATILHSLNSNKKLTRAINPKHEDHDPLPDYCRNLRSLIDFASLNRHPIKIGVDTMHGATSGVLSSVLSGSLSQITEIHSNHDPYFGGIAPEPTESSIPALISLVSNGVLDMGIAHDGDGDRIIGVIPGLGYLSPHDISVALLWYLSRVRKYGGKVVGSVTISSRLSRVAEYLGHDYIEVPIGFKNACEVMRKENVLLAGEENGGIGLGFYLPERDATLAALLLMEAQVTYRGGIKAILNTVEKIVGPSGFARLNLRVTSSPKTAVDKLKSDPPSKLADQRVINTSVTDGIKMIFESGDWAHIRAAGTEDLVRIYVESSNRDKAMNIASAAAEVVRCIEGS